jgi:hypothetical protein
MIKMSSLYYRINLLVFIIILPLILACEEIISIDLNSVKPMLTMDGVIEQDSVGWLKVAYTSDYFSSDNYGYVEDAVVILEDNAGSSERFEYKGNGLYSGMSMKGKLYRNYTITVSTDNFQYSASSELMGPPRILSVTWAKSSFQHPGLTGSTYGVRLRFTDDPDIENYYSIVFLKNGIPDDSGYTLIKDYYSTNANAIDYSPRWRTFEAGDVVTVVIYSIDKSTYAYYSQLNDILKSGMGGSSTPYNPESNFGSSVLGYFRAFSSVSYTSVVE